MQRTRLLALLVLLLLPGALALARERDTALDALTKEAEHEDWARRVAACEALAEHAGSERAAALLVKRLDDDDWGVQIAAAKALGGVAHPSARDALVDQAIEGDIHWVRDAAVEALEAYDREKAADSFLHRIKAERDDEPRVRALRAFGRLADPGRMKELRRWMRHREEAVAAAAVRALGAMAARTQEVQEAYDLLEPILDHRDERKDFFAYAAAIDALGAIDEPRALHLLVMELLDQPDDDPYIPTRIGRLLAKSDETLLAPTVREGLPEVDDEVERRRFLRLIGDADIQRLRVVVDAALEDDDPTVRSEAARTLRRLGGDASRRALEARLEDEAVRVRYEVVDGLAATMEPPAFRGLAERIREDDDPGVRTTYVVALHDEGDPAAIPTLAGFLRDEDWRVATAAACAIGTLGIDKDLPLLEPLLEERDWRLRAAAYEGMGRLRAVQAIPHLAEGLDDRDPVVRGVCHANLQILTRETLEPSPKVWRRWFEEHGGDLKLVKRSRMSEEEREREEAERASSRYAHEKYEFERDRGVEILQNASILVVSGAWDHVEVVLGHLDIPNTLIRAQQIKTSGLNPNQVILVNCEGSIDRDSIERLRWFVNVGGYLMTTDWALTKTVNPCFPGYMEQFSGSSTGNDVVVVEEAAPGHPFVEGIFEDVPALLWWLEVRAFPIEVTWPERCEVLVDSAEMRQRYGSSPMATTFRWGLGKVQHSISHFYLQEEGMQQATDPHDRKVFAADNLGLSLEQIRALEAEGAFEGSLDEETMGMIAPDYSMFRLIVNVVKEKQDEVENL